MWLRDTHTAANAALGLLSLRVLLATDLQNSDHGSRSTPVKDV